MILLAQILAALACVLATAVAATVIGLAVRPWPRPLLRDDAFTQPFGDQPTLPVYAARSKTESLANIDQQSSPEPSGGARFEPRRMYAMPRAVRSLLRRAL